MHRILFSAVLYAAICFSFGAYAFAPAARPEALKRPSLSAAVVRSVSDVNEPRVGMIVHDASADLLKGYTLGGWVTLGSSTSANPSQIRVEISTGNGSANTTVRYFQNIAIQTGSDITYAASSVNGDTFTINTTGVYTITYRDNQNYNGITLNSTGLSTAVQLIPAADRLLLAVGGSYPVTVTVPLTAGDVIRAQGSGAPSSSAFFSISRML